MAIDNSFGRAVFEIAITDEAVLRAKLTASERTIAASTSRMTQSFNQVAVASSRLGDLSTVGTTAVTTLGAAAAATGSRTLGLAASISVLVVAAKSLGDASKGATVQIVAWGKGIVAFMVSPAGLALTAVAALAAGLFFFISRAKEARREASEFALAVEEINKAGLAAAATLSQRTALTLLERDEAKGLTERGALAVRSAKELLAIDARIATAKKARDTASQALSEFSNPRAIVEQQLAFDEAKRLIEALGFLRMAKGTELTRNLAELRRKNAADELSEKRAQEDKLVAIAKEGAIKAEKARADAIKAASETPLGKVLLAAKEIIRERRENLAINKILDSVSRFLPGNLGEGFLDSIRKSLGVGVEPILAPDAAKFSSGSVALSAFTSSGAGRSGGISADPAEVKRDRLAEQRTKDAKDSERHLRKIAMNSGTGGGGGGAL